MSVDAATVKRIGRLARIRVEENEVEKYQGEINAILGFVEQLDEVNVEGVEPMTSVTPMQLRRRDDVVTDGGYPVKVVASRRRRFTKTFASVSALATRYTG